MSRKLNMNHAISRGKKIRICFALFLSALCGCSTLFNEVEQQIRAGELMEQAQKLEQSGDYQDAASLYTRVAEHFSKTRYRKEAVQKAAYLYSDPQNPGMDFEKALYWFRKFSELKLWEKEKKNTDHIIAILEYLKQLEYKYSDTADKIDTLETQLLDKTNTLEELSKMNLEYKEKIETLEEEIIQTKTALERLKEIDRQLHENRIGK